MIDESLIKEHSIGRDGFVWWLGQVCEADKWQANVPPLPVNELGKLPGFKKRVKVSILGYHTWKKTELKNEELPWAYCLLPTTAGGNLGGFTESVSLAGGEWVFGFFLDGEDAQQPVIIGILGKSNQPDFRKEIPDVRYKPFSGYTNYQVEPLSDIKKDETIETQAVGDAVVEKGSTGVKVTKTLTKENALLEADLTVRPKSEGTRYKNCEATGEVQVADPSDEDNPLDSIEVAMKRVSKLETLCADLDGVYVNKDMNELIDMKKEHERAAKQVAAAQKTINDKVRGKTLEAISKASSNIATFTPLSKMIKSKTAIDKSANKVIGNFNDMIDELPKIASEFVKLTGKQLVNQPPCVTEDFVGGLMGNMLGNVDVNMNEMMSDVNNVIASVDTGARLAKQGLGAVKALSTGNLSGATSLLTDGLNSLGGVSVNLDGITKFVTSYEKLMEGEKKLPAPKAKKRSILGGGKPLADKIAKMDNVLEKISATTSGLSQLSAGISNLSNKNSIFDSLVSLDNTRIGDLDGLGGITDALDKAKNSDLFKNLPGTTGESVIEATKSLLEGGDTVDAAIVASDTIYPGAGKFVKGAFKAYKEIGRTVGGTCATGPSLNGPPKVKIFGGGGTGAIANAVIGPKGNLLAIDLVRPGKGYTSNPYAVITDSSGKGKGAVAQVVLAPPPPLTNEPGSGSVDITGRQIEKIRVLSPGTGYLMAPDGSVGGNGRTFAEKDHTVLKDKEGNFYSFKPGTGVKVPPGGVLWFPAGSKAELPTSATILDGDLLAPKDKTPGKIKSIQLDLKRGFKGFAKVTDGSRENAGPVYSIRDAVTDRKISNLLEVQTGLYLNASDEFTTNPGLFDRVALLNNPAIEVHGNFGTAATGSGVQRLDYAGNAYRTIDPWRSDFADGTRLTFRSLFNHNTGVSIEGQAHPYDLSINNHRYIVFEYEVEVYSTPFGYAYAKGTLDPVKKKWYKLIGIKVVTATQDWYNGEVIRKRLRDKAGRLYELYLKICTEDTDTVTATGAGLNSLSDTTEIVRTALPCSPKIVSDKWADYRPTRWHRTDRPVSEQMGHIPGTERNNLIKEIVKVYNSFGDKKNGYATYRGGRFYVDQPGMQAQVNGYLRYLKRLKKGLSCELENYVVKGTQGKPSLDIVYENLSGMRKAGDTRLEYDDDPTGGFDVNGAFTIKSTTGGVTAKFNHDGTKLDVNGKGTVTLQYKWNDIPGYKSKALDSITIAGTKWTQEDVRRGSETHTISVNSITTPDITKQRTKKVTPLTEQEYNKFRDDFRIINKDAFNCLKKDILGGAKNATAKGGPIVKEEHYCEWATEYVEEVRDKFKLTGTQAYELPCGGEITAPPGGKPPIVDTYPKILEIDEVNIDNTGQGYNDGDTIICPGAEMDPIIADGRIIGVNLKKTGIYIDYPDITINTDTGAGASITVTLKTRDPDSDLLPADMIEVIDCVGKNIYTVES